MPEHSRSPRCRPPRSGLAGISGNSSVPAGESAVDTAGTAELLVSELVTNAVRFASTPAKQYSDRVNAGMIWLSVRHFGDGLLIEVFDTDANPPVLTDAAEDAENGRGLLLVDALSKEWSYFFPPSGGKVVYCFIEIPMPQRLLTSTRPVRDWIRHGPGP